MELYLKLFDVLFPVFFVIGVGYYLGVKDPKFEQEQERMINQVKKKKS